MFGPETSERPWEEERCRGRGSRQEGRSWEEGPRYAMSGAKGGSSVREAGPRAYTRHLGQGREAGAGPGGGPGGGTSACGGDRKAGPQREGAVPVRRLQNSGLFPLFLHSFPAPRWMSLSASTTSSCPPRGTAPEGLEGLAQVGRMAPSLTWKSPDTCRERGRRSINQPT